MSDLNLRAIVQDVLANTDAADPGDIANTVLARVPRSQSRHALEQTLRLFVRQVISETRTAANPPTSNVAPLRPTPSQSWKGNAIRDGWQRRLRDRVHVGDSRWKLLGECGYDDLMAAAAERQELADRNSAWARTYRAFATAVSEAGVDTFADLPTEEQMHLLGSAA